MGVDDVPEPVVDVELGGGVLLVPAVVVVVELPGSWLVVPSHGGIGSLSQWIVMYVPGPHRPWSVRQSQPTQFELTTCHTPNSSIWSEHWPVHGASVVVVVV